MQITETQAQGLKRGFKVVVPASDIGGRFSSRLAEVTREARLPGFRPGRAPLKLIKQRFGQSVLSDVLQGTLQETSTKLLSERGLKPAMTPKIEIKEFHEGKDLEFDLSMEILPEITPMDFSVLELEKLSAEPIDSDVEDSLKRLAENNQRWSPPDASREAAKGDLLMIDYDGTVEGARFDGGTATDVRIEIGSSGILPGFADPLIGHKAGEVVTVNIKLPGTFQTKAVAGKDAAFTCTIKQVHAPMPVVVDDEFAKSLGFDALPALREAVKERMKQDLAQASRTALKRKLFDELAERHSFPAPEGLVEQEFKAVWRQVEVARDQGQLDAEDAKRSPEELKAEYERIALRRVRLGLLLSEVSRRHELTVTQEELNRAVMEEARRYPGEERKVIEYYRANPQARVGLQAPIIEEKVVDFILTKVKTTEKAVSASALFAVANAGAGDTGVAQDHGQDHDHDHDHDHGPHGHDH